MKKFKTVPEDAQCVGDGKDDDKMRGKGIYVGESARSMYERAKEHEADRVGELEESHQIKHWVLDHPELTLWWSIQLFGCSTKVQI